MHIRMAVAVSGLLALATAPLTSHAGGADRAVNACVKAFVENYLPKDQVVRVRRVESPDVQNRFARQPTSFTIALTAHGVKSGVEIAQARCVASARGEVMVLDNPPVESYVAKADYVAAVTR
jgi:hypothetical protein